MAFKNNWRKLLEKNNKTQAYIAQNIGCSEVLMSHVVNGLSALPTIEQLNAACILLGCTKEDIYEPSFLELCYNLNDHPTPKVRKPSTRVTLSTAAYEHVCKSAEAAGMTPSAWLSGAVLFHALSGSHDECN